MFNKALIFIIISGIFVAFVYGQGGRFGGGRRMRCPDGSRGFRRCNGFDPTSCQPNFLLYCYAPADAGVCCRRQSGGGGGRCPRPSRRPCFERFGRRRSCFSSRECRFGQICCNGPCGRRCTFPRRF